MSFPYHLAVYSSDVISGVWWQYLCGVIKKRVLISMNAFTWFYCITPLRNRWTVLWLLLQHMWEAIICWPCLIGVPNFNPALFEFLKLNVTGITRMLRTGSPKFCWSAWIFSLSLSALSEAWIVFFFRVGAVCSFPITSSLTKLPDFVSVLCLLVWWQFIFAWVLSWAIKIIIIIINSSWCRIYKKKLIKLATSCNFKRDRGGFLY